MLSYLKRFQSRDDWFENMFKIVAFEAQNFADSTELRTYLLSTGAEIISMYPENDAHLYHGQVRFQNFEAAFHTMCHHSKNISFTHPWYTDWSSHRPDEIKVEDAFLESMSNALNDDCVYDVLKYLSPLQLLNISKRNNQIASVITSRMPSVGSRLEITVKSVGPIRLMNFRYMLAEYGGNIDELLVEIDTFPKIFGIHTFDLKYEILFVIHSVQNLKKLYLIGFKLDYQEYETAYGATIKTLIDSMKAKGVQIVYN